MIIKSLIRSYISAQQMGSFAKALPVSDGTQHVPYKIGHPLRMAAFNKILLVQSF